MWILSKESFSVFFAEAEDDARNSHLLFTIHVYQYRVEKTNQGENGGMWQTSCYYRKCSESLLRVNVTVVMWIHQLHVQIIPKVLRFWALSFEPCWLYKSVCQLSVGVRLSKSVGLYNCIIASNKFGDLPSLLK
jgi:hypothetical protein